LTISVHRSSDIFIDPRFARVTYGLLRGTICCVLQNH